MAVSTSSTGDGFSFSKGTVILLSRDGSNFATEDCLIVFCSYHVLSNCVFCSRCFSADQFC